MRTMRIDTPNTHGTGCTLSSAIAALLPQRSAQLQPVAAAVRDAQHYLQGAIAASGALKVGTGPWSGAPFLPPVAGLITAGRHAPHHCRRRCSSPSRS